MTVCLMFCVACSTNPLENWEEMGTGNVPGNNEGGAVSGSSDASGSLLDFDVSWDDVADDAFTDATEAVVTDTSHEEYDDFVEHSSFASSLKISYSGSMALVSGAVNGVSVTTDGAHVTVNSSVAGVEYVLDGSSADGFLKVYSEKKFKLTLNGLSLTSTRGAAINIQSGKRVFVETKSGTENVLTDAADYTNAVDGEDQKACFFSEGQLIFAGNGRLTVNANYKHGICSDDYVRLRSGVNIYVASAPKDGIHASDKIIMGGGLLKLSVTGDAMDCEEGVIELRGGLLKANVSGAASKAVKAKTNIVVSGGQQILLTSGNAEYDSGDADISSAACLKCGGNLLIEGARVFMKSTGNAGKGINCDGTLTVTDAVLRVITTGRQYVYGNLDSSAKGIKADGVLTLNSGTVWVKTPGGEGSEGIESKSILTVNGGEICVFAYDDCMNASSSIVINGGNVYCYSSGNDGIDSNGTLTINGGMIIASGATSPEEGIDCDQHTFKITGGTLIGIGGGTSTPTSNVCTQRSVVYGGSGASSTLLSIVASDGTHVMSYAIPRTYQQMTLLFSSPRLASDTTYTLSTGGSVSGGTSFCGLTTGGTYTAGSNVSTFTLSGMVTTVGSVSGGGPGGGPGGGWHW